MLFGHIETREHRVDHILRLRDLQDITGGFNAFIPLVFQTENNYLKVKEPVTANEILKLTQFHEFYLIIFQILKHIGQLQL